MPFTRLRLRSRQAFWPLVNSVRVKRLEGRSPLKLHVGCGEARLPGFVNVDVRLTSAVDVTLDLNRFDLFDAEVDVLFGNAFFEHLYRDRRLVHLRGAYRALRSGGILCYLGLPNFPVVARTYLDRGPGTVGPRFDLYHVYRYTHGDPEQAPGWYLDQLHKSLFDEAEIENLLRESGFESFTIFEYAYPSDAHPVPVNLGFYALKEERCDGVELRCRAFLAEFPDRVAIETLRFLS
jgi:predicted SAM-dependent methyltransferase